MVSINELAAELKEKVEFQTTPRPFTDEEYIGMIVYGLKHLFIDTGRAKMWSDDLIVVEGEDPDKKTWFNYELTIDELEYVLLLAQIHFFEKVRASVNEMVSYTTDALSVTQGDKPYANISGTIRELTNERRIVYYKMTSYLSPSE